MIILKVIHGYPMRYNAGSEVYSQMLCQGLAERNEVHVFSRVEDSFAPEFSMRTDTDPDDPRITLHLVNVARSKDRYRHEVIDAHFADLLRNLKPDVVHIGHLNHLSTSLMAKAAEYGIPIVYTLHDYWLMCPRGQFMQFFPKDQEQIWEACDLQDDRKCAVRCYARYFSGASEEWLIDVDYWTNWVARRMSHVREMMQHVDLFIAPAHYLYDRYHKQFGVPENKLLYLDYGFALERLQGRHRVNDEPFTFGYIGTHIPAKGIHHLIDAFGKLTGKPKLRIWGRHRGQDTDSLKSLASRLPHGTAERVEWLPEYRNQEIVTDVFNQVDAIVVPSIWVENSPLVIHEALQARVPVITADAGGMAEYVHHEVNGLTYEHRNPKALASQMQRLVDDLDLARTLGSKGYIQSPTGDIPTMKQQVIDIEAIYAKLINEKQDKQDITATGPWRITFDTNPQLCNLTCIMCEQHSPYHISTEDRNTQQMPISLLKCVLAEAVPNGLREIIPSTMGEPLLYGHFEEIIDLCKHYGIKLNLTTNGTFPRLGATSWAKKIVPVTSDIKISWNGATKSTQESIMLGSRWGQSLENIKKFIKVRDQHTEHGGNRCRVTLQMTFQENNVNELAELVKLAIGLGVDRVKGHHIWTHFDETKELSMRRNADSIDRWNKAVIDARSVAELHLLPNGKRIILDNFYLLGETASTDLAPGGPCPFLGKEAWVSSTGRFSPCCAPDAQRRALGTFGNLNERGLMNIWNSPEYKDLVSKYKLRELCTGCNMRKPEDGE